MDITLNNPFGCWVVDGAFSPGLVEAARVEWPAEDWPYWHRYNSKEARKLATRDPDRLPPACRILFNQMAGFDVLGETGMHGLFPDLTGYGAGLHWIPQGGHLSVHLDSSRHPTTGWYRRLSACLYLDHQGSGGTLNLYSNRGRELVQRIEPKPNRLILFETTDHAYHGVPDPVTEPDGRKSIALFFWSVESPASTGDRTQAEFV